MTVAALGDAAVSNKVLRFDADNSASQAQIQACYASRPMRPVLSSEEDMIRRSIGRRDFFGLLASATVAAWTLAARAQQGGGMRRIGVLAAFAESDREGQARVAAFR